jgi:hypothetical protein
VRRVHNLADAPILCGESFVPVLMTTISDEALYLFRPPLAYVMVSKTNPRASRADMAKMVQRRDSSTTTSPKCMVPPDWGASAQGNPR